MVHEKFRQDTGEGHVKQENQERRRRCKRKSFVPSLSAFSSSYSSSSSSLASYRSIIGKNRRDTKLASQKREQESRGTRTRRRINAAGSLSSRGSANTNAGMQCGLCAVLASLFRRAMCIAGSRRGSGESCYQELATEIQQGHVQLPQQQQQRQAQRASPIIVGSPIKIILPSRSGSLGSINRLNESLQRERTVREITVDSSGQNAVFVRNSDASLPVSGISPSVSTFASYSPARENQSPPDPRPRLLSEPDRALIENLNIGRCRTRHTGRFLTMHKRRRKRLITRSLNHEHALLDDIFHGQVQCVLQKAGNWRFNAFTLETVTGGRSLPVLCVHLFHYYGLFQCFNLDVVRVWKLFALIEEGYHSTNPYHNSIHATDVTQAMHCFLQEEKIKRHLSSLEIMASLIAAVTHDLDHPGVNQPFLVATSNHLATLYENTSVLENHHWRSAIGCLLESGVSEQLPAHIRPELQRHISSLILATDITRQQEFLTRFKSYLDDNALDMELPENRHFILQISLKCADISNPCRPWDISRKWSYKVCEEFFRQGDYERRLNIPVTPLCDRQSISIPRIQAGFFQFVVTPLYEEWHRFLGDGLSVSLMLHLRDNQKRWDALMARETAEETRTEMSDLEQAQNSSTSEEELHTACIREDSAGSLDMLIPDVDPLVVPTVCCNERRPSLPVDGGTRRVNRRHSVPISCSKPFSILPMIEDSSSGSRRESLPSERARHNRPLFRLDDGEFMDEALCEMSSMSLLSSKSSVYESAGNASLSFERPVSAENLLPDTSITSITSSAAASRLSSVLQHDTMKSSGQTKHLTRQQTFPPLQPYVRMRYMSTTAEMSKCQTEILMEADDSPTTSSEYSPMMEKSVERCCSKQACCETDCESKQRSQRDIGSTRLSSKEHSAADNRNSKRGEFAFTDFTRKSLDNNCSSSFGNNFPRRHSVQAVRSDDPNILSFKTRQGRPSSAQEAYPAQMLYASLIGGTRITKNPNFADSRTAAERDHQKSQSPSVESFVSKTSPPAPPPAPPPPPPPPPPPLQQRDSTSSSVISSDKLTGLSKLAKKSIDSEMRRYSTPTTDTRTITSSNDPNTVRRFTAIPVASELPTRKFFIGSPPGSPPRLQSVSSSSDSGSERRPSIGDFNNEQVTISVGIKRDSDSSRQKNSKMAKLSDEERMKENLDPRAIMDDSNKSTVAFARRTNQGWARRRGSAPVGLLAKLDDCPIGTANVATRIDRHGTRRGSVPTDIIGHQVSGSLRAALGPRGENVPLPRRASLPQEAAISNLLGNVFLPADDRENFPARNNNNNNNNGTHTGSNNNGSCRVTEGIAVSLSMTSPRRGSVPADISELRRDLFGRNSVNGKTRNRKKTLRRRSSGGPEMFSGRSVEDNDNGKLIGWRRDMAKRDSIPEPSVKRRGSLPVEMVSIFHPGTTTTTTTTAAGARRSSLWRF